MLDPKIYLEKDPLLHADMLDALMIDGTAAYYSEEDGVMLRIGEKGPYLISAATEEAMEKMAKLIDGERFFGTIRPFKFLPKFFEIKGNCETEPCYQASFRSKELLNEPEVPGIEFRPLTEEHLSFVCEHYDDEGEYMKDRIEYGMLGAFDESGNCAGFIGFHGEGAMGLLRVLPEYRRRGIAMAFEARLINERIKEGRIPYGHVVVGNEKSMCLQRKMGMEFSDKLVIWVFK